MPFSSPPSSDSSTAGATANAGTVNEFAFYSAADTIDSTPKVIIRPDAQIGIDNDIFVTSQCSVKAVEGGFQVLNADETEQRAILGLESQALGGYLQLFDGTEAIVGILQNDGSGNLNVLCKAAKSINFGRNATTPPLVISDVVHLATIAIASAGDIGMGADGRPTIYAANGFSQFLGIGATERKVAVASDICDYLYDSGPKTIATSTLTVVTTIAGPASGKMYAMDVRLVGKLSDETSGEHLVRRIIAINNAGTITVTQGTNSGVSGTLGDAFGFQVNGANLELYIDPGDAAARNYRLVASIWACD